MTNTTKSTVIFNSPCFIKAWTQQEDGIEWLTVYRSVLVNDSDLPQIILDMLNSRDYRVALAEVVADDDMIFGEGLLSVYRFTS